MSVNKEFHIKEYENMNGTAVNNRLVTAIDARITNIVNCNMILKCHSVFTKPKTDGTPRHRTS